MQNKDIRTDAHPCTHTSTHTHTYTYIHAYATLSSATEFEIEHCRHQVGNAAHRWSLAFALARSLALALSVERAFRAGAAAL